MPVVIKGEEVRLRVGSSVGAPCNVDSGTTSLPAQAIESVQLEPSSWLIVPANDLGAQTQGTKRQCRQLRVCRLEQAKQARKCAPSLEQAMKGGNDQAISTQSYGVAWTAL